MACQVPIPSSCGAKKRKSPLGKPPISARCTPKLYELIRADVFEGTPAIATPHYWAMAFGEGGRLWDECQEKEIAAVGWDEYKLGDLAQFRQSRVNSADLDREAKCTWPHAE